MPEHVLWNLTLDLTGSESDRYWPITINADGSYDGWSIILDGDDDAINAATSRDRIDRWALQLDLGAGFVTIPPHEFTMQTIEESLERWGGSCSFSLHGKRYSPQVLGAMRGTVGVIVTETLGIPSAPVAREVFRGVMVTSDYNPTTRTAQCMALDESGNHAERIIAPYLEPSSGKTRIGYALELLSDAGLSVGEFDLGSTGTKGITKPVSKVDVLLYEFLRDWIAPTGARIFHRNGKFHTWRWDSLQPAVAELRPNDLIGSAPSVRPPAALEPTKFTAVTVNYNRVDSSGLRTVSFKEEVFESYARKGAINKQDSSTGAITSVSYGDAVASTRLVRKVLYRQIWLGNVLYVSNTVEYEYRARRMARLQLETDGTTVNHYSGQTAYQYADGNWYYDKKERFIPIRNSRVSKRIETVNGSTRVSSKLETREFYHLDHRALFELTGSPAAESFAAASAIPLTEDGQGVQYFMERRGGNDALATAFQMGAGDERIETEYDIDSDGFLTGEKETTSRFARGARASSQRAGSFVYGLDAGGKEYWTEEEEALIEVSSRRVRYQKIDDDNYLSTETRHFVATNRTEVDPTEQRTGSRPRPEEYLPQSRSQEIRSSATDEVREFLAGQSIEEFIQNEYCQDDEDTLKLAEAELRFASGWRGSIVVPHSHVIRIGHYVDLAGWTDYGLTVDPMRCVVWATAIDCQAKTKALQVLYVPPEVG